MKIMICDDIQGHLDDIENLCWKFITEKGIEAQIKSTINPEDIFVELPDLLILDIEMPERNGIEIKNALAGEPRPLILFATSYEENMQEAFGPNVIGFLRKPIERDQLFKMMDSAANLLDTGMIVTFEDGTTCRSRTIVMITANARYTEVELDHGEKKKNQRKSMKQWEIELERLGFLLYVSGSMVAAEKTREDMVFCGKAESVDFSAVSGMYVCRCV